MPWSEKLGLELLARLPESDWAEWRAKEWGVKDVIIRLGAAGLESGFSESTVEEHMKGLKESTKCVQYITGKLGGY